MKRFDPLLPMFFLNFSCKTLRRLAPFVLTAVCVSLPLVLRAESEYPLTRLGIEGYVANGSLTLTLSDGVVSPVTLASHTWTNNAPATTGSKMLVRLLPELNYYLKAVRPGTTSSTPVADRAVELMFDIPQGYQLLVDARPQETLKETLFDNGTQVWALRLVDQGRGAIQTGGHLPPYVGENHLMDIYLGFHEGGDNGWIRLKKPVYNGSGVITVDRSLVDVRREFLDVTVAESAPGYTSAIQGPDMRVALTDLAGGGFKMEFFGPDPTTGTETLKTTYNITRVAGSGAANPDTLRVVKTGGIQQDYVTYQAVGAEADTTGQTWTITQGQVQAGSDIEWRRKQIKRWTSAAGTTIDGITWHLKEEETHFSRHARDGSGYPTGSQDTDAWSVRYFKQLAYDASLNPAQLGGENTQYLLIRHETAGDANLTNPLLRKTDFTYYETLADGLGCYGKLRSRRGAAGDWIYFVYDETAASRGAVKTIWSPVDDYALPATGAPAATDSMVKNIAYGTWDGSTGGYKRVPNDIIVKRKDVQLSHSTIDPVLGYAPGSPTGATDPKDMLTITSKDYSDATNYLQHTEKIYSPFAAANLIGRPIELTSSDGTQQVFDYTPCTYAYTAQDPVGTITTTGTGHQHLRVGRYTKRKSGTAYVFVPNQSTRVAEVQDIDGRTLFQKNYVVTDAIGTVGDIVSWRRLDYDAAGQNKLVTTSAGTTLSNLWDANGRLQSTTDELGQTTGYLYDYMGRTTRVTTAGVTSLTVTELANPLTESDRRLDTVYDGLGRPLLTTVSAVGGTETINETLSYFPNGRLKEKTAACCATTTYGYPMSTGEIQGIVTGAAGAAGVLTTEPTGAKELRTFRRDGSPYQLWRTDPASGGWVQLSTSTAAVTDGKLVTTQYAGSASAAAWQQSTLDWLGRPVGGAQSAFLQSGDTGSSAATTTLTYATATGRLLKSHANTGRADMLYDYDDLAGRVRSALDMSGNAAIETAANANPALSDRVTDQTTVLELSGGQWWSKTTTQVYLPDGTAKLTGTRKVRLSGYATVSGVTTMHEEIATDISGRSVTTVTTLTPGQRKAKTTVTDSLTGISTHQVVVNGLPRAASLPAPSTGWVTHAYDGLGRLTSTVHPHEGTTHTGYVTGSTKPAWQILAGKTKTTYEYFSSTAAAGARTQVQHLKTWLYVSGSQSVPASYGTLQATQTFTYNAAGLVYSVSGDGVHGAGYAYDSFGRRTLQTSSNQTGADAVKTTWVYDAASGLLKEKRYYENATTYKAWAYTYDRAGAVKIATDPRHTVGVPYLTTYGYNAAGENTTVDYAGDTAAEVSTAFDRLGRPSTIADETMGTRTFAYRDSGATADLQPGGVTFTSDYYGPAVKSMQLLYHEAAGDHRPAGLVLKNAAGAEVYRAAYGYQGGTGLLSSLTTSAFGPAAANRTFSYGYGSASNPWAIAAQTTALTTASGYYRHDYHYDELGRLDAVGAGTRTTASVSLFASTSTGYATTTAAETLYGHYYYARNTLGQIQHEERRGQLFAGFAGTDAYSGLATSYGYDAKGQLTAATSRRLTAATYGSAAGYQATSLPGLSQAYEYDASGNLTKRNVTVDLAATPTQSGTTFTPNALNQVGSRATPGLLAIFGTADPAAKLAVAAGGQSAAGAALRVAPFYFRGVGVDNSANPLDLAATIVAQAPAGPPYATSTAERAGRLEKAADSTFLYDAAGNLLQDAGHTYTWDKLGRLASAAVKGALPGGSLVTTETQHYRYGPGGMRTEKLRVDGQGTVLSRVRYVYAGMDVIAEVPVTLNAQGVITAAELQKSYVWRPGGLGHAGRLLQLANHVNGRVALAGYDGRGNLTTWTDGASGALLGGRDYNPWGDAWVEQWKDETAKVSFGGAGFGYSTEYKDETGLIYYGFRYYSPDLGRFLSRDPLGESASGVNLYAFCDNDPVNRREFFGLCSYEDGGDGQRSGFFGWLGGALSGLGNLVGGLIGGLVDMVLDGVGTVAGAIFGDTVGDFFDDLGDRVEDIFTGTNRTSSIPGDGIEPGTALPLDKVVVTGSQTAPPPVAAPTGIFTIPTTVIFTVNFDPPATAGQEAPNNPEDKWKAYSDCMDKANADYKSQMDATRENFTDISIGLSGSYFAGDSARWAQFGIDATIGGTVNVGGALMGAGLVVAARTFFTSLPVLYTAGEVAWIEGTASVGGAVAFNAGIDAGRGNQDSYLNGAVSLTSNVADLRTHSSGPLGMSGTVIVAGHESGAFSSVAFEQYMAAREHHSTQQQQAFERVLQNYETASAACGGLLK